MHGGFAQFNNRWQGDSFPQQPAGNIYLTIAPHRIFAGDKLLPGCYNFRLINRGRVDG
jgi:hypothetical protein